MVCSERVVACYSIDKTKASFILLALIIVIGLLECPDVSRYANVASIRDRKPKAFQSNEQKVSAQDIFSVEETEKYESWIEDEMDRRLKAASDKKIILIWSFGLKTRKQHVVDREKCGECEISYNRSLINDRRTQALVFHYAGIRSNDMPLTRDPKQLHIYWTMESSATLKVARKMSLKFEDSYKFNATMTHRLDSTFLAGYRSVGIADTVMGKNKSIYAQIMKTKSKFAMAMISDCSYTPGARVRMKKIQELKRLGLPLDGYGRCFGVAVSKSDAPKTIRQYKFYFSYENSLHCKDYITEKFFKNALRNHAVPVVWGALKKDYEAIAPPGSYIFAEDFKTAEKLVDYLRYLDKNETEYLKYFEWLTMKPDVLPQYNRAQGFCAICRELHGIHADERFSPKFDAVSSRVPLFTDGLYPRTIPSLSKWLYSDTSECFQQ